MILNTYKKLKYKEMSMLRNLAIILLLLFIMFNCNQIDGNKESKKKEEDKRNLALLAMTSLNNSGVVTNTGSMLFARVNHTSTLLPGGKVLIAGGQKQSGDILDSAELYDPVTGTFSLTGKMSTKRFVHTATLLSNGKVLLAGGGDGTQFLFTTELYDPATGTFSPTGRTATSRYESGTVLLANGKVFVVGGSSNSSPEESSAELYNPATGTFSIVAGMSTKRAYPLANLLSSGKVLIAGGAASKSPLFTAEIYDPVTNTYSATGSMPKFKLKGTSTSILLPNNKVLFYGGYLYNYTYGTTYELYDPATGTFSSQGNSLVANRQWPVAVKLSDNRILLLGGDFSEVVSGVGYKYSYPPTTEIYDSNTNSLTYGKNLYLHRVLPCATLLDNGKVLISGGWNNNIPTSSAELYEP